MATTDVRQTVLQIVNEVLRKLAVNTVTSVADTEHSNVLLGLLNEVVSETTDFSNWQELYVEIEVTASSSVGEYKIQVSGQNVKNIEEIVWDDDPAPLEVREKSDIRRLQRVGGHGTPRQFAIVGVSGVNPLFRVHPIPVTAAPFQIALYVKPPLYTTSDDATVPPFSARLLMQGLYAKALLEENGGEPTPQYQVAYAEYERMRLEEYNRLNTDTGVDLQITPTGAMYS